MAFFRSLLAWPLYLKVIQANSLLVENPAIKSSARLFICREPSQLFTKGEGSRGEINVCYVSWRLRVSCVSIYPTNNYFTAFSHLKAPGAYFKLGMTDRAFIWISSLFGPTIFKERVIIRFSWQPSILPLNLKFIIQQINVWGAYIQFPLLHPAFIRGPAFNRENMVFLSNAQTRTVATWSREAVMFGSIENSSSQPVRV